MTHSIPETDSLQTYDDGRTPGSKLGLVALLGLLLTIPLFATWLLIYDRQSQSEVAQSSIAQGWGGPQDFTGPMLVVPYDGPFTAASSPPDAPTSSAAEEARLAAQRAVQAAPDPSGAADPVEPTEVPMTERKPVPDVRMLYIAPSQLSLDSVVTPEVRSRSIYRTVVYDAESTGQASFALPTDLARMGIDPAKLRLDRAELRFGLRDARGLQGTDVTWNGARLTLQSGNGPAATSGAGFFAAVDASGLRSGPQSTQFKIGFRGNESLNLIPYAGETNWSVKSGWAHPGFSGRFLPAKPDVSAKGFAAKWTISNLALNAPLVSTSDPTVMQPANGGTLGATINLVEPVDLYDQVSRAAKYGFLFIGFTFLTLLMFDIVGGVRVSSAEYLLVGAALILFFVMLLAFAEVLGFAAAYLIASAAIIGLITAYSAAILKSWKRAQIIAVVLTGLYAALYVLLSLEAYSLIVGSLILFAALAGVMYATRRIDWGGMTRAA